MGATPTPPTPLVPASLSLKPMRLSFSSLFLRRPQNLQAKIAPTARMMAPPTPQTTPMMVFLVAVDMVAFPLLLDPPSDKLAEGVLTLTEVELLTDPSDWVMTTTVVAVVGVGVAVVASSVDVAVVTEAPDDVAVPAGLLVLGAGVSSLEVEVAGASVEVVGSAGGVVAVGGSDVEVEEVEVGVSSSASDVGVVVAGAVFPLPLGSALPCLLPTAFTSAPRKAASRCRAWVAVVAERAATSSLRMVLERIL